MPTAGTRKIDGSRIGPARACCRSNGALAGGFSFITVKARPELARFRNGHVSVAQRGVVDGAN
jgi:hypothetical protein